MSKIMTANDYIKEEDIIEKAEVFYSLTIKDLQQIKKKLNRMAIPTLYQMHSIPVWRIMRSYAHFCFAKWTDKELNNYNKSTGLIGNKCGVDCYVSVMIN